MNCSPAFDAPPAACRPLNEPCISILNANPSLGGCLLVRGTVRLYAPLRFGSCAVRLLGVANGTLDGGAMWHGPPRRHEFTALRSLHATRSGFVSNTPCDSRLLDMMAAQLPRRLKLFVAYNPRPWSRALCAIENATTEGPCVLRMQQPCHDNVCHTPSLGLPCGQVLHSLVQLSREHEALEVLVEGETIEAVNVTFTGTRAPHLDAGWPDLQGGYAAAGVRADKAAPSGRVCPLTSALRASVARLDGCRFKRLGGAGAHVTRLGIVRNARFESVGGCALYLGWPSLALPPVRGTVSNCAFEWVGHTFDGSVPISASYAHRLQIVHNTVVDAVPYTAFSVGWGWARTPHPLAGHNLVANNLFGPICTRRFDGGAVYLLGTQSGTRVEDNWHMGRPELRSGGCWSYYFDDGSANSTLFNNSAWPIFTKLIKGPGHTVLYNEARPKPSHHV